MKKQSFVYGAAVLAAASIICKIMSAALKIPLDRFFLHEDGIGVYQSAYSIYNVFLAICVTGIPIALSGLIASSKSEEEASSLAKSTFVLVTWFSVVSAAGLFLFATPLAKLLSGGGSGVAAKSLRILSPALLVMGIISSRRGYFQGKSLMTPSAVSQLFESLVKVALGIGICALTYRSGIKYGAAGAIAGVTLGAFASAAVLEISFRKAKGAQGKANMKMAMKVLKISIPVTLGAFGFTAVMLADTLTVPKLLAEGGFSQTQRLKMFGYLTRANTVYNLPATIITAFTASAVPAIAAVKENAEKLSENTQRAIKLIFLAAFPCALGMALFSGEILTLLYNSSSHYELLALAGGMIVIMPFVQTTTAMLQTLGKVWQPIIVTVCSIILKIVLNFIFVAKIGVEGAPLATILAFLPAMLMNAFMLGKKTSIRGAIPVTIKLLVSAGISCLAARLIYTVHQGPVTLLLAIAFAAVIYGVLVIMSRCITKEEL